LEPVAIIPDRLTTAWKVRPGEEDDLEEDEKEEDPGTNKPEKIGGKQRKGSLVDMQSSPPYGLASYDELHSKEHRNFWRRLMQNPPLYDLTPPAEFRSEENRKFWRRLMHI
jgi:hypothetical protein